MKSLYLIRLIVCLHLTTSILHAQVRMENLGVAEGLSQGFITSMIQDSHGFIWIGTFDGLNRYDGYQVRRFTPKPFDPWAIQASYITRLYEDKWNLIWVGTHQGIYVFDPLSERFFNLSLPEYKIPANEVYHVTGDLKGNVYLHIPSDHDSVGLYRLSLPSNFVQQIRHTEISLKGIVVDRIVISERVFNPPLKLYDCIGDTMVLACDSDGKLFRHATNEPVMHPFDPLLLPGTTSSDHSIWWGKHESWFYRWALPDGCDSLLAPQNLLKAFRLRDGGVAIWNVGTGIFYKKTRRIHFNVDCPSHPKTLSMTLHFKRNSVLFLK